MRVLHVMEATVGGTRRHIVDLCGGLARAGLDVALAASALRQPDFERDLAALAAAGVRVHPVSMVRRLAPAADLAQLRELERILRRERPRIVHTHSSKAGVLGRLASLSTGIGERVHTPHTFAFLFHAMFSALQRRLFRELELSLSAETARVIAVSESEAETFRASGVVPPERIRVVPNGIDARPWMEAQPADKRSLGVPQDAPMALVAGLLNVAKGQDLALLALAEPGLEELHLVLAGHGETQPELEALAGRLGASSRVHFLGWRTDLPSLVAAADLVLVPSRWEGMPYIVLEAMAAARPVVAARVDGARELVVPGETGLLVEPGDPAALAAALRRVLAMPAGERAALGLAGRERVLVRHTAERMVAGLLEVYAELA